LLSRAYGEETLGVKSLCKVTPVRSDFTRG